MTAVPAPWRQHVPQDAAKQAPSGGSHTPLRIRGAGSKDFYGGLLAGEVLDVSGHRGIVVAVIASLIAAATEPALPALLHPPPDSGFGNRTSRNRSSNSTPDANLSLGQVACSIRCSFCNISWRGIRLFRFVLSSLGDLISGCLFC